MELAGKSGAASGEFFVMTMRVGSFIRPSSTVLLHEATAA